MLGFALRVLLVAAAGAAATAVVVTAAAAIAVYIDGTITQSRLKEKLREKGVEDAVIKAIDHCDNVVTIEDMDSDKTVEIHGDGVSFDLSVGDRIYV